MKTINLTSFCLLEHKWKLYVTSLSIFWLVIILFFFSFIYQYPIINIASTILGSVFMITVGMDLIRSMVFMIKFKTFFPLKKYRLRFLRSINNEEIILIEKIIGDLVDKKIISIFTYNWLPTTQRNGYYDNIIVNNIDQLMLYKLQN